MHPRLLVFGFSFLTAILFYFCPFIATKDMRYFIHLAYKGTHYRGWQRQKQTAITVQQTLEDHLSKMLKQTIKVAGCGRTDAGVHASQYFLHFDWDADFGFDPVERLNQMLPNDITIYEFIPVGPKAHTQYDAVLRTYEFCLHLNRNPFLNKISLWLDGQGLDYIKMQQAVDFIARQADFRSMCKKPNQYKTTLCDVAQFDMAYNDTAIKFTITANRFLQSMVRLIVARVLEIGAGRYTLEQLATQFETGAAPQFPMTAFPQGLYLSKVVYPYLERANQSQITRPL